MQVSTQGYNHRDFKVLTARTEREIKMVSLKKVLIPIVLLLALLPLGTVSADIGPKPTMDFEFIQQTPGAALTIAGTAIFFECEQADCQDEKPLGVGGPQRFSCGTISCHVLAYGFTRYHRLEIQFSDGKTRKSNVFQTAHFNSVYKVTIRPDDLLVEPQFGWDSFSDMVPILSFPGTSVLIFFGCICGILVLVILLVVFLIRRLRKKNG